VNGKQSGEKAIAIVEFQRDGPNVILVRFFANMAYTIDDEERLTPDLEGHTHLKYGNKKRRP
jgi:hypothetical protein